MNIDITTPDLGDKKAKLKAVLKQIAESAGHTKDKAMGMLGKDSSYDQGFEFICKRAGIHPELVKRAGGLNSIFQGVGHLAAKPVGAVAGMFGARGGALSERLGAAEAQRGGLKDILRLANEETAGAPTPELAKRIQELTGQLHGAENDVIYSKLGKGVSAGAGGLGLAAYLMSGGKDKQSAGPKSNGSIYY